MARVLVVDDDKEICGLITDILAEEGHEIVSASNGAEGLRLLHRGQFDLILLDMRMPIMDGWQFLEVYNRLPGPRPPVVICTAQRAGFRNTKHPGAVGMLLKPFDMDDLLNIVGQHSLSKPPRIASQEPGPGSA